MRTFKRYVIEEMARPATPGRGYTLSTSERNRANKLIHDATKGYHDKIPLSGLFDALNEIGVHAVQEDGTPWQGMLIGGGECGSEKAMNQRVTFHLVRTEDGTNLNNTLFLSWCKMPSGRYEVVSYLS